MRRIFVCQKATFIVNKAHEKQGMAHFMLHRYVDLCDGNKCTIGAFLIQMLGGNSLRYAGTLPVTRQRKIFSRIQLDAPRREVSRYSLHTSMLRATIRICRCKHSSTEIWSGGTTLPHR